MYGHTHFEEERKQHMLGSRTIQNQKSNKILTMVFNFIFYIYSGKNKEYLKYRKPVDQKKIQFLEHIWSLLQLWVYLTLIRDKICIAHGRLAQCKAIPLPFTIQATRQRGCQSGSIAGNSREEVFHNYNQELRTIKCIAPTNGYSTEVIDRLIIKHNNKPPSPYLSNRKYISRNTLTG